MHGAQILPFLGAPFERFDLFRVGWGGARGSRTALALYGAVLVFRALSPFVRSGTAVLRVRHTQLRAAPRSHAGCSCCRARLRVRRACYPPRVRWRTFRVVPRGTSAFASRRWVCPASPSTCLLPCASVSRRGTLLIWLGFRMRPAPASLSSRPRRDRTGSSVSFTAENMAL